MNYTMEDFEAEIERAVEAHNLAAGDIYKYQHKVKGLIEEEKELFRKQVYSPYKSQRPFDREKAIQAVFQQARADLYNKVIPKGEKAAKEGELHRYGFGLTHFGPETKRQIKEQSELRQKEKEQQAKSDKFNQTHNHGFKAWNDRKAMEASQSRMLRKIKDSKENSSTKPPKENKIEVRAKEFIQNKTKVIEAPSSKPEPKKEKTAVQLMDEQRAQRTAKAAQSKADGKDPNDIDRR